MINWEFWDAVILSAASQLGCRLLLSEDLGGMKIPVANPNRSTGVTRPAGCIGKLIACPGTEPIAITAPRRASSYSSRSRQDRGRSASPSSQV